MTEHGSAARDRAAPGDRTCPSSDPATIWSRRSPPRRRGCATTTSWSSPARCCPRCEGRIVAAPHGSRGAGHAAAQADRRRGGTGACPQGPHAHHREQPRHRAGRRRASTVPTSTPPNSPCCPSTPTAAPQRFATGLRERLGVTVGSRRHRHDGPRVAQRPDRRRHRCGGYHGAARLRRARTTCTATNSSSPRSPSPTRSPRPPIWSRAS